MLFSGSDVRTLFKHDSAAARARNLSEPGRRSMVSSAMSATDFPSTVTPMTLAPFFTASFTLAAVWLEEAGFLPQRTMWQAFRSPRGGS